MPYISALIMPRSYDGVFSQSNPFKAKKCDFGHGLLNSNFTTFAI